MKYVRAGFFVAALTGCAGLIGVPDLTFQEGDAGVDTPDGSPGNGSDANTGTNHPDVITPNIDAGGGADGRPLCDETKVQTDDKNCGRCGHDCVGGKCTAGKCEAVQLGLIPNAPLRFVTTSATDVFVSGVLAFTTETGGLWRIPKAGGAPENFVTLRYAERAVVLGDKLYFVVDDTAHDGVDPDKTGGLYSCPLTGPCTPTLIAAADSPSALAIDNGHILYSSDTGSSAIMQYVPGGAATVFRADISPYHFWIDNQVVYYPVTYVPPNPSNRAAILWEISADGGAFTELTRYQTPKANSGVVIGSPNAIYFAAQDYDTTTGGIIRRVPRPGSAVAVGACDYGGSTNLRPYGVAIDDTRIYWTNQGLPTAPYADAKVATCPLAGCCTTAEVLWAGDGAPIGIAADEKALYFVTNKSSTIWKIAKP